MIQLVYWKKILGNKIFWLLAFLMVLSLVYLNQFSLLMMKDPVLTDAAGNQTAITLPYIKEMPETEYVISGKINYHRFLSADKVHIIPDDQLLSIRVNQLDIPLNDVDPAALSDFTRGFHFNLGRYLRDGSNDIEIRIKNKSGASGLFFQNSPQDIKTLIADWLLMISLIGILYLILTVFIANKTFAIILSGGFLIRVLYFFVTPYNVRQHDVWEHAHYFEYIFNHGALPPLHYNLETYQPPVYYVTSALIYKLATLCGVNNTYIIYQWLQMFSVLLFMGFLLASLFIFKTIFAHLAIFTSSDPFAAPPDIQRVQMRKDRLIALMLGLITFWPSGIMHSVRIGNDVMFYFFYAWALLFLVKWYFEDTDRNFYTGLLLSTLCFITKSNGSILYGITGIIFLLKFFKERDLKKYLIRAAVFLVIFSAGFLITFGATIDERLNGPTKEHFMVGGTNELGGLRVGDQPRNFLWFDLPKFVTEPYVSWEDQGSRQYFWNYLFKTGIMGEFFFETPFHWYLAIAFSILFLGMLGLVIVGLIMIIRKGLQEHLVLFLNLILLLIAAVLIRISLPYTCMNDFRYILPMLISFCFFYVYSLVGFRRKGWIALEVAGYILAALFITISILFFIALQF